MFRVLSAEEAEKAIRWKAPEISASAANIIHAKGPVSPLSLGSMQKDAFEKTSDNKNFNTTAVTSAPALQAAQSHEKIAQSSTTPLEQPSVSMMQSSYDEGYEKGFSEGIKALMESHVAELATLIASIRRETEVVEQEPLEKEVYGLSIDIARVLLQREIELVPGTLSQLVKAGLEQLPSANSGVKQVHLHPIDVDIVRRELGQLPDIALVADERLERGECRLQSQSSTVHAGVENWLENMARELGVLTASGVYDAELSPKEPMY